MEGMKFEEMVDFKSMNLGEMTELGEVVKCNVCGDAGVMMGIPEKKRTVRFVHSFNRYSKGSRKKRVFEQCLIDGGLMIGRTEPKKARFKKSKKK